MDSELEKLYELHIWSMKPGDPEAIKRINGLKELARYMLRR